MADGIEVKLEGIQEIDKRLREVPVALRKKVLASALRKGANIIKKKAIELAPSLKKSTKYRNKGTIKKAIKVHVSKFSRKSGDIGVYLGVKPISNSAIRAFKSSGTLSSSKNPNDPYYWRWVHFGHKIVPRQGKGGVTTYWTTLRNGKRKFRTREFSGATITGRRRSSTSSVKGVPFLSDAATAKQQVALDAIIAGIIPAIEKMDRR